MFPITEKTTLVAYYGDKPKVLTDYLLRIRECIAPLDRTNRIDFYAIDQIHATLCGLESSTEENLTYQHNYFMHHGVKMPVRPNLLTSLLRKHLPMQMQFGGFSAVFRQITSQEQPLHQRSFSYNIKTGKFILCGWPHISGDFRNVPLLRLRIALEEECHFSHKYKEDNDLFMVLGSIRMQAGSLDQQTLTWVNGIVEKVRKMMSSQKMNLPLGLDDLTIVDYQSPELPPETSKRKSLE